MGIAIVVIILVLVLAFGAFTSRSGDSKGGKDGGPKDRNSDSANSFGGG